MASSNSSEEVKLLLELPMSSSFEPGQFRWNDALAQLVNLERKS